LGIISIRVSSDIPVQSSYLPLISLFFMMNLLFIFIAFGWFCLTDQFRTRKYAPMFISKFSNIYSKKTKNEQIKKKQQINYKAADEIEELCKKTEVQNTENNVNSQITTLNFIAFIFMLLFITISYAYLLASI